MNIHVRSSQAFVISHCPTFESPISHSVTLICFAARRQVGIGSKSLASNPAFSSAPEATLNEWLLEVALVDSVSVDSEATPSDRLLEGHLCTSVGDGVAGVVGLSEALGFQGRQVRLHGNLNSLDFSVKLRLLEVQLLLLLLTDVVVPDREARCTVYHVTRPGLVIGSSECLSALCTRKPGHSS